ncbi:ribose 5-phosphate isomerase B [bacterium]|nr:ribose 5-phosphate isomerase B [bacterium]
MIKLWIACDHAAYPLKDLLKNEFASTVEFVDLGTNGPDSVNYPDFASRLCREVLSNSTEEEALTPRGILLCGSGVGMSMSANRFKGIRAVLAFSSDIAEMSRKHNASNVLCLGARFLEPAQAKEIVNTWLSTEFEGGRHKTRVDLMDSQQGT